MLDQETERIRRDFEVKTRLEALKKSQPSLMLESLVSLECYSPNNWFLIHFNNLTRVLPKEKTEDYRLAASWIIEEGLYKSDQQEDGAMTISFKSLDRKGHYLQAVNGLNIALNKIEKGNLLASREATFILRKGLVDNSLFSFELMNKPKHYLRYEDGTLVPKLLQDNNF